MDHFQKIKLLFSDPVNFFREIQNEKKYFPILMYYVIAFLTSFITPFIAVGISHLGVILMRGSKGFFETFKVVAYSLVIFLPYSTISMILLSFITLTFYPNFNYLQLLNPYFLLGIFLFIIGLIHSTYVEVIGISQYHKIRGTLSFI